jgi:hypothetical protein
MLAIFHFVFVLFPSFGLLGPAGKYIGRVEIEKGFWTVPTFHDGQGILGVNLDGSKPHLHQWDILDSVVKGFGKVVVIFVPAETPTVCKGSAKRLTERNVYNPRFFNLVKLVPGRRKVKLLAFLPFVPRSSVVVHFQIVHYCSQFFQTANNNYFCPCRFHFRKFPLLTGF